jgi:hypothetical protein
MAGPSCKTHLVSYASNEPLCHCPSDIIFKARRATTFQKTSLKLREMTFFKNSIVTKSFWPNCGLQCHQYQVLKLDITKGKQEEKYD